MTLLLGLLLALLAVFAVVWPILRPPSGTAAPSILFDEPEDDPVEHRKALALAALKEIEFDRATGKLSESDYQAMLVRYQKEAVEALKAADAPAEMAAAGSNGSGGTVCPGRERPRAVGRLDLCGGHALGGGRRRAPHCGDAQGEPGKEVLHQLRRGAGRQRPVLRGVRDAGVGRSGDGARMRRRRGPGGSRRFASTWAARSA